MKYIDAELLRKEIERQLSAHDKVDHLEAFEVGKAWNRGHRQALKNILSFIDSLQQEQPSSSDLDEAAQKVEDYYDVGDENGYLYCHRGDIKDAFKAGAEWQYQKDRGEFAKLKAKEWCNGYDDAVSQFVKISYEPRDWFSSKDGDFICGASFDEAIPARVELYYRTKLEEK